MNAPCLNSRELCVSRFCSEEKVARQGHSIDRLKTVALRTFCSTAISWN
jgi:hypothetical protein